MTKKPKGPYQAIREVTKVCRTPRFPNSLELHLRLRHKKRTELVISKPKVRDLIAKLSKLL